VTLVTFRAMLSLFCHWKGLGLRISARLERLRRGRNAVQTGARSKALANIKSKSQNRKPKMMRVRRASTTLAGVQLAASKLQM
jgi:hypothetical protein